jgi:uncharacterized coiled-coil protein SlyX
MPARYAARLCRTHRTVQEQGGTIAELKKQVATLTATVKEQGAQIQKVSAQLAAASGQQPVNLPTISAKPVEVGSASQQLIPTGEQSRSPERERENFNHALFGLAFFSRRQDRELLGAISRGLLDCPRRF